MLDLAHTLVIEGLGPDMRERIEPEYERMGHEVRASVDSEYKRETWGRRPEDLEALKVVTAELSGRR